MLVFFKDPDWIPLASQTLEFTDIGETKLLRIKGGVNYYPFFVSMRKGDLESLETLISVFGLKPLSSSYKYRNKEFPAIVLD